MDAIRELRELSEYHAMPDLYARYAQGGGGSSGGSGEGDGEAQQLLPGIDFGSAAFAGHVLVPETSWTARDDAAREVELQNIVAASSSVSLDPNVEEEEALQSV